MSNIEDDANVLGAFCLAGRIEIISPEEFEEVKIAISNILSEREQDKARIKELEEENRIFKNKNVLVNRYFKLKDNSIPKQKVKDVLQNNRNEIFSFTYVDDEQFKPYTMQIDRINKIENELLEEGE